jgi:G3E family GTPase
VLALKASICLVDPEKLKDNRYTTHENFIDQIALSDILIANKMDRADKTAIRLFHHWAKNSNPGKALIAQTSQGQLDVSWLDISLNSQRQAVFPDTHTGTAAAHQPQYNKADGFQSFGAVFPAEICFCYKQLNDLLSQLKVERIKGIVFSDKGWFIINSADGMINFVSTSPSANSRIEIISRQSNILDVASKIEQCKIKDYEA